MLYVDASALVSRYLADEPEHAACAARLSDEAAAVTSRITVVEATRALHLATDRVARTEAIDALEADLAMMALVEVDRVTVAMARDIAVETGARSLDALHLASALRVGDGTDLELLTLDRRQSRAASQLGITLAALDG